MVTHTLTTCALAAGLPGGGCAPSLPVPSSVIRPGLCARRVYQSLRGRRLRIASIIPLSRRPFLLEAICGPAFWGTCCPGGTWTITAKLLPRTNASTISFGTDMPIPWLPAEIWKGIVQPKYHDIFLHGARATLETLLGRQTGHSSFEQRIIRTELEQRQRRFISYQLETLGRHFRVSAPFYDQRVVQFFLAVPINYLYRQRFYRRMIVRFLPELSHIEEDKTLKTVWYMDKSKGVVSASQATLAPVWNGLHPGIRWRLDAVLARTKIRRLNPLLRQWLGQLSGGWLGMHDRTAYAHYDEIIRKYPDMFLEILAANELVEPYFDAKGLVDLLQAHLCRKIDATWAIFNIWTLCMWQKQLGRVNTN